MSDDDDDRIWAHCPLCKQIQRFVRVETRHGFHAVMTLLTVGLWGFSWAALAIGHYFWPWRCKHCGCADPDRTKKNVHSRRSGLAESGTSTPPDNVQP